MTDRFMKITDIVESTHKPGMYRVSIDSKPVGYVTAENIFTLGLVRGRELNQEEYDLLLNTLRYSSFYGDALRYADRRLHSKKEVMLYLNRKGCDRQTALEITARLEALGVIDEAKLAEAYIHDSKINKPMSKKTLELKLKQKNIDKTVISNKLDSSGINDQEALDRLIASKSHQTSYANNKNRLIRYLLSQGFGYEDIVSRVGQPEFKRREPRR